MILIEKTLTQSDTKSPAFESDSFILNEVKTLIKQFNVKTFIETGTNTGKTTLAMSTLVDKVISVEANEDFYNAVKLKLDLVKNIELHLGSSNTVLSALLPNITESTMFYLDAHWYNYCPLLDELEAIASFSNNPIILIHDFFVPNSDLGYMTLPGNQSNTDGPRLDFSVIENKLLKIYPHGGNYYYNKESDGSPRTGCIFITPKNG